MKKHLFLSFFAFFLCSFLLQSQGFATAQWTKLESAQTRTYNLTGFQHIVLNCPAEVHLQQDEQFSVSARTKYDGALELLKLETNDNTLSIDVEKKRWTKFPEIDIYISMPKIGTLTLNGSGDIETKGTISGSDLNVTLNGTGDIEIDDLRLTGTFMGTLNGAGELKFDRLDARRLEVALRGSGDIEMNQVSVQEAAQFTVVGAGSTQIRAIHCDNFVLSVAGSGDFKLGSLNHQDKASMELTGSGDVAVKEINGGKTLATTLRGSGDINYTSVKVDSFDAELYMSGDIRVGNGKVKSATVKVAGSGDMDLRGLHCNVAYVQLLGSGDISLDVQDELYLDRVNGSGEIHYSGSPTLKVKK